MPTILENLFEWSEPNFVSADYRQAAERLRGHHDIIGEKLGLLFLDELCTLESGVSSVSDREEFVRGVQLGFQLFSALMASR